MYSKREGRKMLKLNFLLTFECVKFAVLANCFVSTLFYRTLSNKRKSKSNQQINVSFQQQIWNFQSFLISRKTGLYSRGISTLSSLLSVLLYLTTRFDFFFKKSIKRPGPSQKKLIVLRPNCTALIQGCQGQFLGSIKQLGLDQGGEYQKRIRQSVSA